MKHEFTSDRQEMTQLWDQLTTSLMGRSTDTGSRNAIFDSIAGMHLTAHLICGYVGNPQAVLCPTMTLAQLAERWQRDTHSILDHFGSTAQIATFGDCALTVADPRWLLALWSLTIDMVTTARRPVDLEINLGSCQRGYEIEIGHDQDPATAQVMADLLGDSSATGPWLRAICPEWQFVLPNCPLGGRAVQMNIPFPSVRMAA